MCKISFVDECADVLSVIAKFADDLSVCRMRETHRWWRDNIPKKMEVESLHRFFADDIATVNSLRSYTCTVNELRLFCFAVSSTQNVLETLNLSKTYLGDSGCTALSGVLRCSYCRITSLNLRGNNIQEGGIIGLAQALQKGIHLRTLDLGDNWIGISGSVSLAEALCSEYCKLTSLDLGWNGIEDGGACALAAALTSDNCQLRNLCLNRDGILEMGCLALATAITSKKYPLRCLDLCDNRIGMKGEEAIQAALQSVNGDVLLHGNQYRCSLNR